jgi:hypothetical protein
MLNGTALIDPSAYDWSNSTVCGSPGIGMLIYLQMIVIFLLFCLVLLQIIELYVPWLKAR